MGVSIIGVKGKLTFLFYQKALAFLEYRKLDRKLDGRKKYRYPNIEIERSIIESKIFDSNNIEYKRSTRNSRDDNIDINKIKSKTIGKQNYVESKLSKVNRKVEKLFVLKCLFFQFSNPILLFSILCFDIQYYNNPFSIFFSIFLHRYFSIFLFYCSRLLPSIFFFDLLIFGFISSI